jgi:hypothetical protein
MVVDYNIFNEIKNTKKEAKEILFIIEQTPINMIAHDLSKYLYAV